MPTQPAIPRAVERLISSGPMPLAQLARRARNAKTGVAVLQNAAHYLGEAGAALAAAYWIGRARAAGDLPGELQDRLVVMVTRGASFGGWMGLLREGAAAAGGGALSGLLEPLADGAPVDELLVALTGERDALGDDAAVLLRALNEAKRRGVLGLLDFLVVFRNKVYGHGSMLSEAVARALATPMLGAVASALGSERLFGGAWLGRTAVAWLSRDGDRYWKRLHGTSEAPVEAADELPDPAEASPRCLHFVSADRVVSLGFVVVQDEDDTGLSRFGFFQKSGRLKRGPDGRFDAARVNKLEYLDFLGGRFRHDELRDELVTMLGELQAPEEVDASASGGAPGGRREAETAGDSDERRLGDFVIEAELGRGAMGVVHLAAQVSLGRKVALKVLPAAMTQDPVALGRFSREISALGRCEHPNVVRVLASGIEGGRPWYAMELVRGADLSVVFETLARWRGKETRLRAGHLAAASSSYSAQLLAREESSSERLAELAELAPPPDVERLASSSDLHERLASLFAGAAEGLEEIHGRGVVHRDIKPANLMLTADGERLVIMDLGLAMLADREGEYTRGGDGDFVGSARYAAPEQIQARVMTVDHRADVYSLGAALYELAALTTLYPADSIAELLRQKLSDDPPAAHTVDPAVPVDLSVVLQKAMARRPVDRYRSAAELAADLRAVSEGRPVSARPPSAFHYLGLFYRRERRLVQLAALSLLVVVALVVTGFVLVSRERAQAVAERDRAERLASFIADDLYERLEPVGKLELLDRVSARVVEHYRSRDLSNPSTVLRYAAALVRAGEVRAPRGQREQAREQLDQAAQALRELQLTTPAEERERLRWLARAYYRLGRLHERAGDLDEATAYYQRALDVVRPAAARFAGDEELALELGDALDGLGNVHRAKRDYPTALDWHRKALAVREGAFHIHPESSKAQAGVAMSHNNLGIVLGRLGKRDEALESYQRARDVFVRLVERDRANLTWLRFLAASHNNVAILLKRRGQLDEARGAYRQAIAIGRRLVESDPTNADWRKAQISRRRNLAKLLLDRGELDAAASEYRAARRMGDALAEQHPGVGSWLADAARSSAALAFVLIQQRKLDEAQAEAQQAVRTADRARDASPKSSRVVRAAAGAHTTLGEALLARDRPDQAASHLQRSITLLEPLDAKDPAASVSFALAYAKHQLGRVHEVAGRAEQAVASQRQALAAVEPWAAKQPLKVYLQVMVARCRLALGRLLHAEGGAGVAQAPELLRKARDALQALARRKRLPFVAKALLTEAERLTPPPADP